MWSLPLLWVLAALLSPLDGFALSAAFAVLVAFPVALGIDTGVPRWLTRLAWILAPIAAGSLLLERGPLAAGLATTWLVVTGLHAVHGGIRFVNAERYDVPAPWAEASSALGPVVSAVALVWSRFNGTFAGFGDPLATLTVTHFHFTFGLLPLSLAALHRPTERSARDLPAWGVVFAPPLVGALFALRASPAVPSLPEAGAIGVLALSVAGLPFVLRGAVPRLAGLVLAACTALAAWFSLRLTLGQPTLDYAAMLRWHGVGNALATLTLGLWALRLARFEGARMVAPRPDLTAPTRDVSPEKALFRDHRVFDLGADSGDRFATLADALLRYTFYPPYVMRHASTFSGRQATVGDRIGMTLLVDLFPGYAPIALPATTEVYVAEITDKDASFGYRTTRRHYGKGTWTASLARTDGRILLHLTSRMTPLHPLAIAGLPIYRWYQKRAHRAGVENLARQAGEGEVREVTLRS